MRTTTIPTTAPPTALTRHVARSIREHWHRGDLEAVAEAAIGAVCAHLARTSDEAIDPRVNEAVERFLAYEYHETDSCAALECPDERTIPYQEALAVGMLPHEALAAARGHDGGIRRAEFAPQDLAAVDPDATCSWNVEQRPDGTVDFKNVRPLNPSKALRLLPLLLLALFTSTGCGESTAARDRRDTHAEKPAATVSAEKPAEFIVGSDGEVIPTKTHKPATAAPPSSPIQKSPTWAEAMLVAVFAICGVVCLIVLVRS